MNPAVNTIANRLSLRRPQRTSLEILGRICDIISMEKGTDVGQALKAVQSEFSTVTDFERDFPSFCFALATGVGKTRLMGAFIAYLNKTEGFRHFFVLAPNLTIYNKLIADFTPHTPGFRFFRHLQVHRQLPEEGGRCHHSDRDPFIYQGKSGQAAVGSLHHHLGAVLNGQRGGVSGVQLRGQVGSAARLRSCYLCHSYS